MEHFLEGSGKGRVVGEAHLSTDLSDRQVGLQEIARKQQTLAADVLMDAIARVSLELAHEIELAHIGVCSKRIDAEHFGEMLVDIGKDMLDLGIIGGIIQTCQLMIIK